MLDTMVDQVPVICENAVTEICNVHHISKHEAINNLRNGGAYVDEFSLRRESLSTQYKLNLYAENNVSSEDFKNAMEIYSYEDDFSEKLSTFVNKMNTALQNYILLSSVEDIEVPDWLNHNKIIEIFEEMASNCVAWCNLAVDKLCEFYKVKRSDLNVLFSSDNSSAVVEKFTEIYKEINEEGRKTIYNKYNVSKEVFEAATFRAQLDDKEKDDEFNKRYSEIQERIEKSINEALTPPESQTQ